MSTLCLTLEHQICIKFYPKSIPSNVLERRGKRKVYKLSNNISSNDLKETLRPNIYLHMKKYMGSKISVFVCKYIFLQYPRAQTHSRENATQTKCPRMIF